VNSLNSYFLNVLDLGQPVKHPDLEVPIEEKCSGSKGGSMFYNCPQFWQAFFFLCQSGF
jgi:hypothetical protein